MAPETGKAQLQARLDTYLVDRTLNLHNILVGVALGIAGLAATNLMSAPAGYRGYQVAFWMLWFAGLFAVVTAYAGAVIGSVLLPSRVPGIWDLLVPLVLGISEFLLFGILANKVTGLSSPASVMIAWFFTFTGFCIVAAVAVWRACRIIDPGTFSPDVAPAVRTYLRGLRRDMRSALGLAAVSFAGALVNVWVHRPVVQDRIFASVITAGLVAALVTHEMAAKGLRDAIHPGRTQS